MARRLARIEDRLVPIIDLVSYRLADLIRVRLRHRLESSGQVFKDSRHKRRRYHSMDACPSPRRCAVCGWNGCAGTAPDPDERDAQRISPP
jgi:hypothetical protein